MEERQLDFAGVNSTVIPRLAQRAEGPRKWSLASLPETDIFAAECVVRRKLIGLAVVRSLGALRQPRDDSSYLPVSIISANWEKK
jgi:hypothetical protein